MTLLTNIIVFAAETGSGWNGIWWAILGLVIGAIAGFFISRKVFQNQLKKNPPINEKMIRAMFLSMGRKPSESQIKQVMSQVNSQR